MRRISAVALIILLSHLLGHVSGQSSDFTPVPLTTQEAIPNDLIPPEPELIATIEPQPTNTLLPTETSTPLPDITPLPTLEVTSEMTPEPQNTPQSDVIVLPNEVKVVPDVIWDLSVRELFDTLPASPWVISSSWIPDSNQRLSTVPSSDFNETRPVSIRYEAALIDVQTQAAFFLSDGTSASVAVRVTDTDAYTAELDAAGAIRLLRSDVVVAENTLILSSTDSHILNLMVVGSTISVRVDDELALSYNDPLPLPTGAVTFGGLVPITGVLALDDVFIWLPHSGVTVPPIAEVLPIVSPEATAENLPTSAESAEVSAQAEYQGPLTIGVAQTGEFLPYGAPQTWSWYLASETTYVVLIEKLDGTLRYDVYVQGNGGMSGRSSNEGGFYEGHWGGNGTFILTITPIPSTGGNYRVTVLPCCKPIVPLNETRSVFSSTLDWEYNLTIPTEHYIRMERTAGDFTYEYTIKKRGSNVSLVHGYTDYDLDGLLALYVPSTEVGIYDITLKRLARDGYPWGFTEGSYRIGLYHGYPFPPAPTNFRATEIRSNKISLAWDANAENTDGYDLLRYAYEWEYMGNFYADETTYVDPVFCNSIFHYALIAYNWAGDADIVYLEDVQTPLCPPPNDIRWRSELVSTFPWDYTYSPDVAPISSAENNEEDQFVPLTCAPNGFSASIWYLYNTTKPAILKITTEGSTYDTVIGLYQTVNGKLVQKACHDNLNAAQDDFTSQVIYEVLPNQQYMIMVANQGLAMPEPTDIASVHFVINLAPPILKTPINLGTTKDNLTWNSVPNAAKYHIQVAATNTFANRLVDEYLTETSFDITATSLDNLPNLPDGKYFWRVRTVTADGLAGFWSSTWAFTKDTLAPSKPTISAPVAKTIYTTLRPSFTASVPAIDAAKRYEWQIATDDDFEAGDLVTISPNFSTTPTLALTQSLAQGAYYVRVRACDAIGNCGDNSDPRLFYIDLRQLPANDAPVIVTGPTSTAVFRWTLPQGVTAFTLQVSTDNNFGSPLAYSKAFNVPTGAVPLTWTIPNLSSTLPYGPYYWRLLLSTPSLPDVPTIPRRFIVTPPLAAAPVLIAQPNTGILNTRTVKVDWKAPAYIFGGIPYNLTYQMQVDNVSGFTSPEYISEDPIVGLTHTTSALPADGIYYIRVRAVNDFGGPGAWSLAQKITVDTALPPPPTISVPYVNAWTSSARQPVTWAAVAGVNLYHVQYSTTEAFNPADLIIDVDVKTTTYTPTISLAQGQYYVRVKSRDLALNWGDYGTAIPFMFTANTTPANNGNLIPKLATTMTPVFKWTRVPGATQYQVIVAKDPACTVDAVSSPVLGPSVYTWTYSKDVDGVTLAPLGHGAYYWCVAVNRGAGTPAAAALYPNMLEMPPEGFRLNITPSVPPAVTIQAPVTAMLSASKNVEIRWTNLAVSVPNSPFKYEVQVDNNPLFNDREFETITDFNEVTVVTNDLLDGKYNLRIRAINSAGGVGLWSVVRVFTIDTTKPRTPAVLKPTQDSTFAGLIPTITWEAIPDAVQYVVQVSQTPNFSPFYEWRGKPTTLVMPFALLNQSYYVQVKSIDLAGNDSPFSTPRVFNVQWPITQAPIPVYYTTSTPTLAWEKITWATRYEIQVSANPAFTVILATSIKGNSAPADTTFDVPPRVDGVYYWRVRAGNSTQWFPWSDTITFAVDS